jgi:hypothetical protein
VREERKGKSWPNQKKFTNVRCPTAGAFMILIEVTEEVKFPKTPVSRVYRKNGNAPCAEPGRKCFVLWPDQAQWPNKTNPDIGASPLRS